MTIPTFQIPIAGQDNRHYDRNGPLEWKWCFAIWVLFKDRFAVAWLVPSDHPSDQWRIQIIDTHFAPCRQPASTTSSLPTSKRPRAASRPGPYAGMADPLPVTATMRKTT